MWLFMISNSISFGLVILACLVFFTLIELWLYAVEKRINNNTKKKIKENFYKRLSNNLQHYIHIYVDCMHSLYRLTKFPSGPTKKKMMLYILY